MVTVTLTEPCDPLDSVLAEKIEEEIQSIFLAEQLYSNRSFKIGTRRDRHAYSDKSTTNQMHITAKSRIVAHGEISFVVYDKDSNVIRDSRKEIAAMKSATRKALIKNVQNDLLRRLLLSYQTAINDPANEFFHLREIEEALTTKFGHYKKAKEALNIDEWGSFIGLVNNRNIRQGAHRGQSEGQLRDATTEELNQARTIGRSMIEAYIKYLERSN
jgi:hypothetical protein